MRFVLILLSIISLALSNSVTAQSSKGSSTTGEDIKKTKVLVLATPHLQPNIGGDFSPVFLDSLISVLEKYDPNIIGIEVVPGTQFAAMDQRHSTYKPRLGGDRLKYGKRFQEDLNISWQKAHMIADSLLRKVQNTHQVTDSTRLKLINYMIASYRFDTAALQWSYISERQRNSQSVIPEDTAEFLEIINNTPTANEIFSIAHRLAHKLDHQRLYPIDYHLEKDLYYSEVSPTIGEVLDDSTESDPPYRQKLDQLMKQGIEDSTLFPLYQFMNSPAYVKQDKKIQWRNDFLETGEFNDVLRQRLALWEVRNLGIATNIRKASAHNPGGRVLVIIGGSHKAFLDSYFKEMMGVEVVHLSDFIES
jgi:hypothetical protein